VRSDGPGKGSRFTVSLPAAEAPLAEAAAAAVDAQPPAALRVLVVDDNRDAADSLALLLRTFGHEAQVAYDGASGIEAARRVARDVVLLDIGLPRMSGLDVCRAIRTALGEAPPILIAITGWAQDEDRRRSKEAGFDWHLVKPVDPQALLRLLGELTRGRRPVERR
jgi:CheY-like chemotaxis protein